jgi:hypothetical protein
MNTDGGKKSRTDGWVKSFVCKVQDCGLRARVKYHSVKVELPYCVESHNFGQPVHNHSSLPKEDQEKAEYLSHGLPPEVQKLVDEFLAENNRGTPSECIRFLASDFSKSDGDHRNKRYKELFNDNDEHTVLKKQVTGYFARFSKKKYGNNPKNEYDYFNISTNDAFLLPQLYSPRDNFFSPKDIMEALHKDFIHSKITFYLGGGSKWYQMVMDTYADESSAEKDKASRNLSLSYVVVTPASLYALLVFLKRRNGLRSLNTDGTHGLVSDGTKLIAIGPLDIHLRAEQGHVTASLRNIGYLVSPEEYKASFRGLLVVLIYLSHTLFHRHFQLDFGTSDKTAAFINNFIEIPQWRAMVKHKEFPSAPPDDKKPGPLNCWFHISDLLNSSSDLRAKFGTKKYIDMFARNDLRLSHKCKSFIQFNSVTDLFMKAWEKDGEECAASHIRTNLLVAPWNRWYYMAAGQGNEGVTPQGSSSESWNIHGVKGSNREPGVAQLNICHKRFYAASLTDICKNDASAIQRGVCIEIPLQIEHSGMVIATLMKEGKDFISHADEDGKCWLGVTGPFLGERRLDGPHLEQYYALCSPKR